MSRFARIPGLFTAMGVALLAAMLATPSASAAAELSVGWALTHVGLHDDGGGLVVGVGARSLVARGLSLGYAVEYAQKRGVQPTIFTSETNPSLRADAEVTLHVAQTLALLELTALPPALPHPYAGLSVALKLSEQWSAFPGEPSTAWAYKDTDFFAHAGLARQVGPVRLDLRYSRGLTRQLIIDPSARAEPLAVDLLASPGPAKAVDLLPGVREPIVGAHLWQFQLAASLAF
jgi:hypothetical protein